MGVAGPRSGEPRPIAAERASPTASERPAPGAGSVVWSIDLVPRRRWARSGRRRGHVFRPVSAFEIDKRSGGHLRSELSGRQDAPQSVATAFSGRYRRSRVGPSAHSRAKPVTGSLVAARGRAQVVERLSAARFSAGPARLRAQISRLSVSLVRLPFKEKVLGSSRVRRVVPAANRSQSSKSNDQRGGSSKTSSRMFSTKPSKNTSVCSRSMNRYRRNSWERPSAVVRYPTSFIRRWRHGVPPCRRPAM